MPDFTTNGLTSGFETTRTGAHLSYVSSSSISSFLLLLLSFITNKQREGRGGAPALRWMKDCDTGGNTCSRATRTQGGWLPVQSVREETGTAAARDCSGNKRR
uniref:Uncharacterized protein n=1 Tax=Oryza barthii TaxID=65489 RepID=A0A0D3HLD8_9ORYZ